jgi:hypothetical protein
MGGRCQLAGKEMLTAVAANESFGYSLAQLSRWFTTGCEWLGRKIGRRVLVREPCGSGWRWRKLTLIAEGDLQAICDSRAAGRSNAQDPWPSTEEVGADGWNDTDLKRLRRRGKVKSRPGLRVRPDDFVARVTEWCPADLAAVRKERQTPAEPSGDLSVTDEKALKAPFSFPPTTVARWRFKEPGSTKHKCPYLGRALRAEKRDGVWYNSRKDLEAILAAVPKLGPRDEHVDSDGTVWLPTGLVEERHGIIEQTMNHLRKRDERDRRIRNGAANGRTGGRPRSAPSIRSKIIDRPHPKIPDGEIRVWHQGDVLHYVRWRNGDAGPDGNATPADQGTTAPVPAAENRTVNGTPPADPLPDRGWPMRLVEPAPVYIVCAPAGVQPPPSGPYWDGRALWFDGVEVTSFDRTAGRQGPLLQAFQASGWKSSIPNPFSDCDDPAAVLVQTLNDLNSRLPDNSPLKFGRGSKAFQAFWKRQ